MTNEIKEVIEALKRHPEIKEYSLILTPEEQQEILYYVNFIENNNTELQQRIDKAIEYIKNTMKVNSEYPDYIEMEICEYQELLEILQGEENEK